MLRGIAVVCRQITHIQATHVRSTNCHLVGYAKRRDKNSVSHEEKNTASVKKLHSPQVSGRARANISSNGKYHDKSPAKDADEDEIGTTQDERQARNEAFSSSGKTQPEYLSNNKTAQNVKNLFEKVTCRQYFLPFICSSLISYKINEWGLVLFGNQL